MAIKTYSKAKEGNTNVAKNFKVREFACQDGSDKVLIDTTTVNYLQDIRDHFGKPVIITSAYRTASHNRKVGGATNSLHTKGQAVDFYIGGVDPAKIAAYAESLGCIGIGLYTTKQFVHIDSRTTKYLWRTTDGVERRVDTHGGTSPRQEVKDKCGLSDGTMAYLDKYTYATDLYKKISAKLK